jgi:hypothetical protein
MMSNMLVILNKAAPSSHHHHHDQFHEPRAFGVASGLWPLENIVDEGADFWWFGV